jgi:hypothetical protein
VCSPARPPSEEQHTARRARKDRDEFYPTPAWVTDALLQREEFGSEVWEPACGDGSVSRVLEAAGYHVISTDTEPRGYGDRSDFLEAHRIVESIVTNPPYSKGEQFVRHALASTTYKVALLLPVNFLESRRRADLFADYPPARLYTFARRVSLYPGGERGDRGGGVTMYCWFVWEHGYRGDPTVHRIE